MRCFGGEGVVYNGVSPIILKVHMILDGREPIVGVRLATGLDGDEAGTQPRGDRGIGCGGELQVALAVTNSCGGGNDGSGSGAASFGEFSPGVCGANFINGDFALFRR